MTAATASRFDWPRATAGELAVLNLESSLQRSWQVLARWPERSGTAERIVAEEHCRAQFLGDVTALDRLVSLSSDLCRNHPLSVDTHLIAAQVASMRHYFDDARMHLARADAAGASPPVSARARLTIDQATGANLPAVLESRQALAAASSSLNDLVPLGALLADLGEYEAADRAYLQAIHRYRDVSPFALAWACFQVGVLWGETVPSPDPDRAAYWYERAVDYLPAYTHARVHLAELHCGSGALQAAEALLLPILASGDPEVRWRLADVLAAQGRTLEAERELETARGAFEMLLGRHELAFADHAAEFYLGSGSDPVRVCEYARLNLVNRPTRRAYALAQRAALANGATA